MRKFNLSTTHILLLSFLICILIGAILLSLPISSANNTYTPFIDALFTATTSTCVTGLVITPTVSSWSVFGQIVILCLIQIGGLGIITAIAGITIFLNNKLKVSDGILLQDTLNLNTMSGITNFIKKVIIGTFVVESIGAILYMFIFIPDFGPRGIWISIFTSISAFCNAGIDIISETSLYSYATNPVINITTMSLIVLGGLGYIVWWDVIELIKKKRLKFKNLTLHSKITILTTLILIITGAVLFFVFEYNNNLTIGNYSIFDKLQISLFQSITTRTAGFASVPQENLTNPSIFISIILMFIGGSPVGTAGGVKTVTFVVLILSAIATIRNKNDADIFNRKIPKQIINKSISVITISFITVFISTLLLSATMDANAIDILFETVSATATVGLTRNLTSSLNNIGKIIIICTMYLGRVGPISLALAFNYKKEKHDIIKNPEEEISVG